MTLVVHELSKDFGGLKAVDTVSFVAERGKLLSLVGPNGAGKTTCFNALTGFLPVTSGRVELDGRDITRLRPDQRLKLGLARTFQTTSLFNGLNCRENVQLALAVRDPFPVWRSLLAPWTAKDTSDAADALLEKVGIADSRYFGADELSYGVQRRLAVAIALASRPQLILLDEPAAGLNPRESESFGQLLRSLVDDGMGVLLVEHDMSLVMEVSDWVHVLAQGKTLTAGVPNDVRQNPDVIAAYLGRR